MDWKFRNKRYINQIVRKLKCSGKRRKEIKKQLISDFTAGIENGENAQDVLERMGRPVEIAEEFNSSFSQEEKRAYKREKWIKVIGIIISTIVIIVGFIWWTLPKQIWIEESKI